MNTKRMRLVVFLLATPLAACAHHVASVEREPEPSEYTIGREDLLEIAVWKDTALTTTAPVRPDGQVSVPMAGDVHAEGKTPHQLSSEIAAKLAPFVKDPVVSVIVREINSTKFAIVGEVAHPGVYPLRGHVSILQAVAQAGGLTEFASKGGVVVIRPGKDGKERRLKVDLDDAVDGDGMVPRLRPGDTVVIP